MGSRGRLNMSAKALCRSCDALVVVLPLSPVVAFFFFFLTPLLCAWETKPHVALHEH